MVTDRDLEINFNHHIRCLVFGHNWKHKEFHNDEFDTDSPIIAIDRTCKTCGAISFETFNASIFDIVDDAQ